ncbi:MAG TPA: hypothetical protein VFW00_08990 [Rhodocyclaceae bacterium]|nr:hypothetical protein [Rhodocyclaceae bacterium]
MYHQIICLTHWLRNRVALFGGALLLSVSILPAHAQSTLASSYQVDINTTNMGNTGEMYGIYSNPGGIASGIIAAPHLEKLWIYVIFWGDYWNNVPPGRARATDYFAAFSAICSPASDFQTDPPPNYLSVMTQFNYGLESARLGSSKIIPGVVTGSMVNTLTQNTMKTWLASPGLLPGPPDSSYQTLYVVIPPPGLTGLTNTIGYHGSTPIPNGSPATPPDDTTVNNVAVAVVSDGTTTAFSRELVNAISDPLADVPGQRNFNVNGIDIADVPNAGQDYLLNGQLVQAYFFGGNTVIPFGPAPTVAGNALASYFDGSAVHSFYIGTDYHIHEVYRTGSTWAHRDLMTQPGTGGAEGLLAPTSLASTYDTFNHVGHVFYVGQDHLVHELYSVNGGTWFIGGVASAQTAPITTLPEMRSLSALYSGIDGSLHVLFHRHTEDDGPTIAELYISPGRGWQERFVAFDPATETQFSSMMDHNGGMHLFYVNINGHIKEAQWNGTQWVANDWTTLSHDPNIVNFATEPIGHFDGLASYDDGIDTSVFYVGNDSAIHEIDRLNTQQTLYGRANVSTQASYTGTPGLGLAGYFDSAAHTGHVFNIDANGNLNEFHEITNPFGISEQQRWSVANIGSAVWSRSLSAINDPVHATQYVFSLASVSPDVHWDTVNGTTSTDSGVHWSTNSDIAGSGSSGTAGSPNAFP